MKKRFRLIINGQVQGIGFRPAIYRYATSLALSGFVQNSTKGVIVEIEGSTTLTNQFIMFFKKHLPSIAKINTIEKKTIKPIDSRVFTINNSKRSGDLSIGMPTDMATCHQCQNELFDKHNRRLNFPFINCTNCGPRYSIIKELPYDRAYTSMKTFTMCESCQEEYNNPLDRRFDAQPNACQSCGPELRLINNIGQPVISKNPIINLAELIKSGHIVALKGLGGYHICCDAKNEQVISLLRHRKHRPHKALAIMFRSINEIKDYCHVSDDEQALLLSTSAPIVILKIKFPKKLPLLISPDTNTIGAFLAYTPVHHLLLNEISPLIMTSANKSDEPIIINESSLTSLLGPVVDYALIHNRPILRRVDDSIVTVVNKKTLFYRRARGYVPETLTLLNSGPPILACGGDLKNTFALTKNNQVYLSQHIGDLKDYPTYNYYQNQIDDLKTLLVVTPELLVHDKHPGYFSTKFAQTNTQVTTMAIQHHHAHIAACMTEHHLNEPVIGIAFDGTGFGDDGHIWGSEFFIADLRSYSRKYHFDYVSLPGNEQAILHPERIALSYLMKSFPKDQLDYLVTRFLPHLSRDTINLLQQIIASTIHSPLTSSAGRLFDAVSALLGFDGPISYEGQAAIQLETKIDPTIKSGYDYDLSTSIIHLDPLLHGIITDLNNNLPHAQIASKFHHTIINIICSCSQKLSKESGIKKIILSGGVFQNTFLLSNCIKRLSNQGYLVYSHHIVPPNDGGLALGQAAIALANIA